MFSESIDITAQEMKFFIKHVFSKCNKIRWRMCSTCCYMMVTLDVNELTVLNLLNEFVKKALQDFFTHKFSYVSFIFSYMVREVGAMRPRSKFYTLETEITDFAPVYFSSSI